MEKPQKKLFLIDAMGLIYRAYYALNKNPRINSKGKNTSAALGFTNSLYEIIRKEHPTHIGIAFDSFGPTIRHAEFADYKANRESTPEDIVDCLPDIRNIISAFRIPLLEKQGYEADDIIGTAAKWAEKQGFDVYMVTADKDYGQLVSPHIFMYKFAHMGNGVSVLGVPEICEKYSIQYPEQLIDLLGLWGDASDNIPGIKGVGEVTAKKLMAQFGSIENMLERTDEIANVKLRDKIREGAQDALTSKALATIMLDVPLALDEETFRLHRPDFSLLKPVLEMLEFRQLLKRITTDYSVSDIAEKEYIPDLFATVNESGPAPESESSLFETLNKVPHQYFLIDDDKQAEELAISLAKEKEFCFDTETDGLEIQQLQIVGISFCVSSGKAWYISVPPSREAALKRLQPFRKLFKDKNLLKIAQNIKFDIEVLLRYDIQVEGPCFDTMLAHYLLEPEQKHNMDQMAIEYLSYQPVSYKEMLGNHSDLRNVPIEELKDYACEDADITFQLYKVLLPLLHEKEAWDLFRNIEMPLVQVLVSMEMAGVHIDVNYLKSYSGLLQNRIMEIEKEIYSLAGESFNIASPKQLGVILFEKMKIIENAKLTKTKQYQTGEEVLQKLVSKHPIVSLILEYRGLQKLKSTYTDAFQELVNPETGRVHTSFNQAVTATGRLSSSNPNLQNIPVRNNEGKEIRKAFVPADDQHLLLAADYSQIELRIMAAMSGDPHMLEAFEHGQDIHTSTAAKIYGVEMEQVTRDMRRNAKTVNFGIIYGMSAFGLSERLGISRKEAADIISQYFEKFSGIKEFMDKQKAFAEANGYVETLCKRRRYLPDINSRNATVRGFAERNAVNAPIQGTAADMIKIAMIKVHQELTERKLKSCIVLQVHDELVLDVFKPEMDEVTALVRNAMMNALPLNVPVEVEIQSGQNWLEAH